MRQHTIVWIKGGGDLGTGVAHRLSRSGFRVVVSELAQPLVVRRAVALASAVYDGEITIEGVQARLAAGLPEIRRLLASGVVPVVIDAPEETIPRLRPEVVVDARMAKRNLGTTLNDAPIVIALGPGFTAQQDAHAVVETMRGHNLGRVILQGSAEAHTGVPGLIEGFGAERVLTAPCTGLFRSRMLIGERTQPGDVVAHVADQPVLATIAGVLRGLLHDGLHVHEQQKVGDIDPRGIVEYCFTISDKARAVGGGVLEAILYMKTLRSASQQSRKGI